MLHSVKPTSHRRATTLRPLWPRESTRSLCGCQISEKRSTVWLQLGLCCARMALWCTTFASPVAFPLWLLHQHDTHTRTSRRQGHVLPKCDRTAMLLGRLHYAAWALPLRLLRTHGIRTTILWWPSAFCCIYDSIPWLARMFWTHIF